MPLEEGIVFLIDSPEEVLQITSGGSLKRAVLVVALEEVDLILEIVRPIILRRGGEETYVRVGAAPSTDILDEGV